MKKKTNTAVQDKIDLQALQESEARFRSIVLWSPDAIIVTDAKGKIEYMNPAAEKIFNRKLESFIGKDFGLPLVNGKTTEIDIYRPGKDPGVGDMYVVETEWLGEKAHLITIRDITERKRTEEALRQSEKIYRTILEDIQEGYFEVDLVGNLTFFNDSLCRLYDYSKEELIGMNDRQYTDKENAKKLFQVFNKVYNTGESTEGFDWQIIRKDGAKRYVEASVSLQKNSSGKPTGFRGVVRDVTEHKRAEAVLQESEDRYRALFDSSLDLVYVIDFEGRFIDANAASLNRLGYTKEEISSLNFTSLLSEDQLPLAFKVTQEIRETGIQMNLLEFRLRCKDGTRIYVETHGSVIMSNGTPVAIQAIARDITERKRAEKKLQITIESLRKAVGSTIQVMVSAIEMRDPYTAGHQFRSANLACTIATEMGLPQEKVDGISMAGSIHDIGKLSIPAEILSKPTKLTNIEFSLIKEHPLIGYEMLKNVESPWPLAQIVYQHHERMDGSGYPRNLKGDEIIMEARIMAVADTVEAMASHRPYRPSLGIDAALEEIEKNRGTLYDNAVADACLRLFRERGYQLPRDVNAKPIDI